MLQSVGSQRAGYDSETKQQQQEVITFWTSLVAPWIRNFLPTQGTQL